MNIFTLGPDLQPVVRIRSIPSEQQEAFSAWMLKKTAPVLDGIAMSEQDAVWAWDYARWLEMRKLPVPSELTTALNVRERRVK